ncbi:hypothetical protein GE061_003758 [Apolygus lucorum]|uniref:Uncharacterized protein n=1 Tax=Apolygus lucorum TaxID=248454 RepID=A0A6A4JM85_APOLU|nr:hypothetical protein GE061_003758 [Apolygus lucorum]
MANNGLSSNNDLRLFIACFLFWCYSFGFLMVAVEATNRSTAFLLVLAPIITYIVIKRLSIPPPSDEVVNEVLGRWLEESEDGSESDSAPPTIGVWAHRFAGLDAPENTLEALDTCIENGAKAVEFDLILTADLVPVVFHDPRIDRMTNCEGDIRQLPWSKVKSFDVSTNHPFKSKYPDAHIPHFEDVVRKCVENQIHMVIDIKDDRPEVVTVIVEMFAKYPDLYRLALTSSFNPLTIWNIRKANPSIVAGLTWRPHYLSCSSYSPDDSQCVPYPHSAPVLYAYRLLDLCHKYVYNNICHSLIGFSVALLEKDQITREVINRWKKQNVRVMAWTVNAPIEKLMFMKQYSVPIITDSMLGPTDPTK